MTIFKCKMCGGTLEFNPGDTVAVCDSCGTKQTLPKLDDDRRANLYDRANHFRRSNEYDKAMGIYEQILAEDNTDAEAYWSLVLCRYGIEYVEDPATHKRVPTVNRAQFTSIFDDDNYKSALHYADAAQREVYESEAKAINEIQKGILAISQKEQPFDVFICYKETDASGRRTPDSVLANDLYHQLTQEGFKVFFARITLEDKLGTAYEPYIFAALNSAKVMVVLGTKPEYFNAVWVKNEWSRYLALVKNSGGKKMLIPAYKDMDPYDLPEEFSHLQAQDMGKLGFMQDLIRGIKKIISADAPKAAVKETVVVSGGNAAVEPLLKRAFMFLEDGNWQEADTYCEKVLDQDPENAQAYLGKLMAQLHIATREELPNCATELTQNDNYQKALRFADDPLRTVLTKANEYIHQRNLQAAYDDAKKQMEIAINEYSFNHIAEIFEKISGFQEADELRKKCIQRAADCRTYTLAKRKMDAGQYEKAIEEFKSISDWRDSAELIKVCQQKSEKKKVVGKKTKKAAIIIIPTVCAIAVLLFLLVDVIIPGKKYNDALALMEDGQYSAAIDGFEKLNGYKDSDEQIAACETAIKDKNYNEAIELMDAGKIVEAYKSLTALDGYKDSTERAKSLYKRYMLITAKTGEYVNFGSYEQDNNTSNGKEIIEWQVIEKEDDRVLVISKYALDSKSYNTSRSSTDWENCSLRQWLNSSFISEAFDSEEQALIQNTDVSADKNPDYNTSPGNNTTDKIFLLSYDEFDKYFSSINSGRTILTDYAVARGAFVVKEEGEKRSMWWLRSPGSSQDHAAYVDPNGFSSKTGTFVDFEFVAVRPAMWLSLK